MLNLETTINGKQYKRVTKKAARYHYLEHNFFGVDNSDIYVLPCKMNPQSIWAHPCKMDYNELFDNQINAYEAFNCTNELGRYAMFFIEK